MNNKIELNEETLIEIQEEALKQSKEVENWYWIKAYEELAFAADILHAFIRRSTVD